MRLEAKRQTNGEHVPVVEVRVVLAEDQRLHLVEYQSGIMW